MSDIMITTKRIGRAAAIDPFKRYQPEVSQPVRKPDVKEDSKVLQAIKKVWRECGSIDSYDVLEAVERPYAKIFEHLKRLKCSAKDVERFSIALAEFQEEEGFAAKAGIFLSVLINHAKGKNFRVCTRHLDVKPDGLGAFNTKNVVIDGDVDYGVGKLMISGSITVNGNANVRAGFLMLGGTLTINGNSGHDTGYGMAAGKIYVNGNIFPRYGDCGFLYHKGELISSGPEATNVEEALGIALFSPSHVKVLAFLHACSII